MHNKAQEILDFWFKDTPPKKRFQKVMDTMNFWMDLFMDDLEKAIRNDYDNWQDYSKSSLALISIA